MHTHTRSTTQPSTVKPSIFSRLVYNEHFDQENQLLRPNNHATVIHNTDTNGSMAQWLRVKNIDSVEVKKPRLVLTGQASSPSVRPRLAPDDTWNEMKKEYGIDTRVLYDDSTSCENDDFEVHRDRALRLTSGQNMKLSNWKSDLTELDSPMSLPKLIKRVVVDSKDPNIVRELNLITPLDQGMVFDNKNGKWVYQTEDLEHITNVSQLTSPSFSESRSKLISILQDVIPNGHDWDELRQLCLKGKFLTHTENLKVFVPLLEALDLSENELTNLHGISTSLQKLLLSSNSIGDPMLSFKYFHNLQILDLSHNPIRRLGSFQDLRNLRELKLQHCGVTSLISLPLVQKLDISHNSLLGELDFTDLRFDSLMELNLCGNQLRCVKLSPGSLPNLRCLNMNENKLTKFSIDGQLTHLKKLLIKHNRLVAMDIGSQCNGLRVLHVDGICKLAGHFPNLEEYHSTGVKGWHHIQNEELHINEHLQSIGLVDCGMTYDDLLQLRVKYPHLSQFDLCDNEIECSFEQFVELFHGFGAVCRVKVEGNPLVRGLGGQMRTLFDLMVWRMCRRA